MLPFPPDPSFDHPPPTAFLVPGSQSGQDPPGTAETTGPPASFPPALACRGGGRVLEKTAALRPDSFPYITGLLTFREAPVLLAALAPFAGPWLDAPAIGCAKTRLVGRYQPVEDRVGASRPLFHGKVKAGAVVRTRTGVSPVFVSPGHLMDTPGAVRLVLAMTAGFRQPEPLRQAHLAANGLRRRVRESIQRGYGLDLVVEKLKDLVQP